MIPITYIPNFIKDADKLFKALRDELSWVRIGLTPRSEYYCNDTDVPYTYGTGQFARTYEVQPYSQAILDIRAAIEAEAKTNLDVCFLNHYHDSSDQLGWHADDSPEMDDTRPIAIVSFGAEREIWFRKTPFSKYCGACNGSGQYDANGSPQCSSCKGSGKATPEEVTKLKLGHGSLCLMAPGMQDTHQHRIPKAGFECGPRISLTFRGYVHNMKEE